MAVRVQMRREIERRSLGFQHIEARDHLCDHDGTGVDVGGRRPDHKGPL